VPHRGGPRHPSVPEAEARGSTRRLFPELRILGLIIRSPPLVLPRGGRRAPSETGEIRRDEGRAAPADRRERASGILDISIANRG